MISRVKNRYSGLSDYLEFGIRKDSIYERDDKDNVIPLFRDLDTFRKAEEYCVQYKNWNKNYEHITIAFSDEDIDILYAASEYERINIFKSIVIDMIKHRTSGYDLDYEIISYAEYHEPKIKKEEKWNSAEMQIRRGHIHIGISLLNALSNTQVATAFYNNKYMSETIGRYMAKKHNLTTVYVNEPNDSNTDIKKPTLLSITREKLIAETKDFRTREELFEYFHEQGYKYDFTNKNSKKYSNVYIIYEDSKGKSKRLNLQGKTHFRNIDIIMTDDQLDTICQVLRI